MKSRSRSDPEMPPPSGEGYGSKRYWEQRYSEKSFRSVGVFDWYLLDARQIVPVIGALCPPSSKLLDCGCGNSEVGEALVECFEYSNVTCVDFSPTVVEHMRRRAESKGIAEDKLRYLVADMKTLSESLPCDYFQLVMDKGGLDALICAHDESAVRSYLRGVSRLLKRGGYFVLISHSPPDDSISQVLSVDSLFQLESQTLIEGDVPPAKPVLAFSLRPKSEYSRPL